MIDPDTQKEMEEKRRRHLQHQEYIKEQVRNSFYILSFSEIKLETKFSGGQ